MIIVDDLSKFINYKIKLNQLLSEVDEIQNIDNKRAFWGTEKYERNLQYLPDFHIQENVDLRDEYPYSHWLYKSCCKVVLKNIPLNSIEGHNCSDGSKPIPSGDIRVLSSISALRGFGPCEKLVPIEIISINGRYSIVNGKHRFCAYYLLDYTEIPCEVSYLDYEHFMSHVKIQSREQTYLIVYESMYDEIPFNSEKVIKLKKIGLI